MKRFWLPVVLAIGGALLWFRFWTVEYRGRRVLLSHPLLDVDSFENAGRKLSSPQARKVQELLVSARVESEYGSLGEMVEALHSLRFPGYGTRGLSIEAPDGGALSLHCVEIPESGRDRCLLFRHAGERLRLLDDVVVRSPVGSVELLSERPVYRDPAGAELAAERVPRAGE
ncbi:MAG: hypothetical protein F9K18_00960 [Thermoanaerobaculia bacterium]|nr:MAG: hypothetical protein F9K18_00960 [Thermoanaerobaculia bacterium]